MFFEMSSHIYQNDSDGMLVFLFTWFCFVSLGFFLHRFKDFIEICKSLMVYIHCVYGNGFAENKFIRVYQVLWLFLYLYCPISTLSSLMVKLPSLCRQSHCYCVPHQSEFMRVYIIWDPQMMKNMKYLPFRVHFPKYSNHQFIWFPENNMISLFLVNERNSISYVYHNLCPFQYWVIVV